MTSYLLGTAFKSMLYHFPNNFKFKTDHYLFVILSKTYIYSKKSLHKPVTVISPWGPVQRAVACETLSMHHGEQVDYKE